MAITMTEIRQGYEYQKILYTYLSENTTSEDREKARRLFASRLRDLGFDGISHYHAEIKAQGHLNKVYHIIECNYTDIISSAIQLRKNNLEGIIVSIPDTKVIFCKDAAQWSTFNQAEITNAAVQPAYVGAHSTWLGSVGNPCCMFVVKMPVSAQSLIFALGYRVWQRVKGIKNLRPSQIIRTTSTPVGNDWLSVSMGFSVKPFDNDLYYKIMSNVLSEVCDEPMLSLEELLKTTIDSKNFMRTIVKEMAADTGSEVVIGYGSN